MIDWQRISELEQDLGKDELPELIHVFLQEVGEAISALDTPTEADLHSLRGTAATLGFAQLADLATQGEYALKHDALAEIDCAKIQLAYTSERTELLSRFPGVS